MNEPTEDARHSLVGVARRYAPVATLLTAIVVVVSWLTTLNIRVSNLEHRAPAAAAAGEFWEGTACRDLTSKVVDAMKEGRNTYELGQLMMAIGCMRASGESQDRSTQGVQPIQGYEAPGRTRINPGTTVSPNRPPTQ